MKTVLKKAVHTIRMKVDGTVREIAPGTHFNCPAGEVEYLTKAGAITDVKEVTAVEVVVDDPESEAAPESQNTQPETGAVEDDSPEAPDLDDMLEDELIEYGTSLGLKLTKRMKVETIKAKIREHLDSEDEAGNDLL